MHVKTLLASFARILANRHCFQTNTVSGLAKAGCLVAFSLTLFVPGFGDIRKPCVRSNQNCSLGHG
ncbi:hypothetical protein IGI04_036917 [Brassica rapa subsp. trilocularis]|uniref:Uncharacterized protein n=1 Tax=Brassica rapa subsp. trilocularis TaxID=1813537 RepID=A0ABQ7LFW3_BRACM|nr:hypothetical protein IGI04_036917 [Brassica rapa subsp. trilocularis]